jgi:hypothetical protein
VSGRQWADGQRRPGGLLWQRSFRLLWFGETTSQLGNAMAVVGVPLVAVIVLHASLFVVGVLAAAGWLPWLVIGLAAGAWVDRWAARRVMIACDLVSAVLYASVPVTARAGVLTTGLVGRRAARPGRLRRAGLARRPQFRTRQEAVAARPKFVSLAEMPARPPAVTAYNAHIRRNPPPPRGWPMTSESHHRY